MPQPKPQKESAGSPDDLQTPARALWPLLPLIKPGSVIWECACGTGNLVRELEARGFAVMATDIKMPSVPAELPQYNFLTYTPDRHYDMIITNPPYSLKDEFIARCYALGKPWALLLPITSFEGKVRQALFKKHGVQVILFDKRIAFEVPDAEPGKKSAAWFATAWFTWGLNLPHDLMFVDFDPPKPKPKSLDSFAEGPL